MIRTARVVQPGAFSGPRDESGCHRLSMNVGWREAAGSVARGLGAAGTLPQRGARRAA